MLNLARQPRAARIGDGPLLRYILETNSDSLSASISNAAPMARRERSLRGVVFATGRQGCVGIWHMTMEADAPRVSERSNPRLLTPTRNLREQEQISGIGALFEDVFQELNEEAASSDDPDHREVAIYLRHAFVARFPRKRSAHTAIQCACR